MSHIEKLEALVKAVSPGSGASELAIGHILVMPHLAAESGDSIAWALEVAKAAREFMEHEGLCQEHQNAGSLKGHVLERLEILGRLQALLAKEPK